MMAYAKFERIVSYEFSADGVAYTFGLFFVKISEDLGESKSATSWIASIMAGMTYGIG
jgi:hypothetical protein